MNKKLVVALIIIVATAVVLLFNMRVPSPKMNLNLVFWTLEDAYKSLVFLGFTLIGVIIGIFLK